MKRSSKSEIRNPKFKNRLTPQFRISDLFRISSFGFRILTFGLALLALRAYSATNISAGDDDLAKLRPPRVEIPPTFWERYNFLIIAGSLVFLALIGIIVWIVTRPKPPIIVSPEVRARQALDPLLTKPGDGLILS